MSLQSCLVQRNSGQRRYAAWTRDAGLQVVASADGAALRAFFPRVKAQTRQGQHMPTGARW